MKLYGSDMLPVELNDGKSLHMRVLMMMSMVPPSIWLASRSRFTIRSMPCSMHQTHRASHATSAAATTTDAGPTKAACTGLSLANLHTLSCAAC